SSRLTKSPSCFSHLSTVPSVTDSPSWGILICDTPMSASVPEGCGSAKLAASGLSVWLPAVPPTRPDRPCDARHGGLGPSHVLDRAVGGVGAAAYTLARRLEATPRIELGMEVLQTSALPLGYVAARF